MTTLMMILGTALFGLGLGLMSSNNKSKKSRKPKKKNFFVRLGESGDSHYNWMGGYTESR